MIGAFKAYAKMLKAELWMSAQTHRDRIGEHPTELTPPWNSYSQLIDVAIFLDPGHEVVTVRLLKDHDHTVVDETNLKLHPDTLRLVADDEATSAPQLPNSAFTLLSGGATGAEAAFGECSEKWGLTELNFSFEGRRAARSRGLVELTAAELELGAVSPIYIETQMRRKYPETPLFRKMLKTIWHQVSTAGEVFAIGEILEDSTVKGGTGWAVELAKHWRKPVHVFDQQKSAWNRWDGASWVQVEAPRIEHRRFAGTGTRNINESGRRAVVELFESSYGAAPSWA